MKDAEILELEELTRLEDIDLGVGSLWDFCRLKSPDYYTEDKSHLVTLCDNLQAFYEKRLLKADGTPYRKMMINVPPRHGKTRTLINFSQWIFGKNQSERIIECSYNDLTAGDFAKYTRDGIQEELNTPEGFVFSDFFPTVKIKAGSSSYYKWALEGQHFNYLGAGIDGSITSKGGSILIIDDPVKTAEEAFNADRLDKIWNWYTGTFLSRGDTEGRGEPLEIVVMTRWAEGDICGRILASDDAANWFQIKMHARDEATGQMLCALILSAERYDELKSVMVPEVFWANYHQETVELRGLLYKSLKTYERAPQDVAGRPLFETVQNYTDTADEGDDFLVSINYGVYNGEGYVLDVIYTKDGMEITEPLTAKFLFDGGVRESMIESNNGGRGFARSVERLLWDLHKTRRVSVRWFHQSANKTARILSSSAFVQEHIYFPVNWRDRWPAFYKAITTFLKEGKNKHDDAPDALTGVAEQIAKPANIRFLSSKAGQ